MSSQHGELTTSSFRITLTNLGVDLETIGGVTYPHHVFGHKMVLKPVGRPEILLPGAYGEVYVERGAEYTVQSVSTDELVQHKMRISQATHDYVTKARHYLPIFKEDILLILEEHPSGWWTAQNIKGAKGIVPSTFLKDFVIDLPSGVLLHEISLMLTAQQFDVDYFSHAPLPLKGKAFILNGNPPCERTTLVELERGVENLLVQRETSRRWLRESLENIVNENKDALNNNNLWCKNTASLNFKVHELNQQIDLLEAHINQAREVLHALRNNIVSTKCEASIKLLRLVREFLGEEPVCTSQVVFYLEFLHGELERYHRDVRLAEMKLSTFSKYIQDLDRSFRDKKELLSYRIGLRDAKIRAMLNFWSEKAETAKEKYLRDKVQTHHAKALSREEEKHLRQLVADGRTKYIQSEDAFRYWKDEVKILKGRLEAKSTLESLEEAIQLVTEEERLWRKKLAAIQEHAKE